MTDDVDVVTELRARWCCILEEQLECPVCFEIGKSTEIHQCLNGHNICNFCRVQLETCPVCTKEFSNLRNRALENLLKQFEDMKTSLMDPEGDKHHKINSNKKSVGCQADLEPPTWKMSVETQTLEEVKIIVKSVETQTEKVKIIAADTQTMDVDIPGGTVNDKIIVVDSSSDSESELGGINGKSVTQPRAAVSGEEMKPVLRRSSRLKAKPTRFVAKR